MCTVIRLICGISIGLISSIATAAEPFIFPSRYSCLAVGPSATLTIDQPIGSFNGTLVRSSTGTITGQEISFVDGIFEDAGNQLLLNATFDPLGVLVLSGGGLIRAQPGQVLQSVLVSGTDNRIEGQPVFDSDISLVDAATNVTFAVQNTVNTNIVLNGGTIVLDNDLVFADNSNFVGSGTINGNGNEVTTGSKPFSWTDNLIWQNCSHIGLRACKVDLTSDFTFQGTTSMNGHGNVLDMAGGGTLIVDPNSSLFLSDVVLKGLGDTQGTISLVDSTSALQMTNVALELDGNLTTNNGTITIKGPSVAIVKDNVWNFDSNANLTVNGVTLWLDQAGAASVGGVSFLDGASVSLVEEGAIKILAAADSTFTELIESRIELLETCCETVMSRTDALDSEIDVVASAADLCCDVLTSRVDALESEVDAVAAAQESCCENLDSRVDILESRADTADSEIDAVASAADLCCDVLTSRVDALESEVDAVAAAQESCCENLDSRVDILGSRADAAESEIDAAASAADLCCDVLTSRVDALDSEIDVIAAASESCCELLTSRVDALESDLDSISISLPDGIVSRIELLETCCETVMSRTDALESEVDAVAAAQESCCENLDSRVDILESRADTADSEIDAVASAADLCCDVLTSRVDALESEVDAVAAAQESCCENLDSRVDILESRADQIDCCDLFATLIEIIHTRLDRVEEQINTMEPDCCSLLPLLISRLDSIESITESCCDIHHSLLEEFAEEISTRVMEYEEMSDDEREEVIRACRAHLLDDQHEVNKAEERYDATDTAHAIIHLTRQARVVPNDLSDVAENA